jgi:hypothetical protein
LRRLALGLVAAAALFVAAPALADGDPASDYLLAQATFQPPDLGTPSAYSSQLAAVVSDARRKGYEIRVAVIGTRYDLGSIPELFRRPTQYARFLGQELQFVYKGRLLVVMPNGYGVSLDGKAQPALQRIVDALPAPGNGGAALTAAATRAVRRLAAAAGVVVAVPPLGEASGSSVGRDRVLIAAAALVALLLAGATWFGRQRLRRRAPR